MDRGRGSSSMQPLIGLLSFHFTGENRVDGACVQNEHFGMWLRVLLIVRAWVQVQTCARACQLLCSPDNLLPSSCIHIGVRAQA